MLLIFLSTGLHAQQSIHLEESNKYAQLGELSQLEYDNINGFVKMNDLPEVKADLGKTVFGYHPYWGGSNYLNYQWDLLSDLCYFSYEVDPSTGGPSTIHSWLTSPAIDSAFANGTRVHLCVTLFSGHNTFFNSAQSRENLTNNIISLVKQRGADGVSFDFEAVPGSQGENMVNYIAEFNTAFHDSLPGGIISMAIPAVDWSGIFDIEELNQYIDFYIIMGYDYFWNGSNQAGPVDPLYSMVSGYDYNVSRTVSYYQSEGMPMDRMLLGVPYYGREWPTASAIPPSSVTGYGSAMTFANVMNNASGNYSIENKHREPNSFGPYFAYYDGGWYQCFVNDKNSLSRRYKIVNARGLAGIGIWALGYDNGYTDFWEAIDESFAQETPFTICDTLYDSGGPSWNYYDDESYTYNVYAEPGKSLYLEFIQFELEAGYDSLWIYDGLYPGGILKGAFSGDELPAVITTSDTLCLRFESDGATREPGWMAVVTSTMMQLNEFIAGQEISVYPNPTPGLLHIDHQSTYAILTLHDLSGTLLIEENAGANSLLDISEFPSGVYILSVYAGNMQTREKIVKF